MAARRETSSSPGSSSFRLRAERQSEGDGRVYGVNFEVKDRAGNARQGLCRFFVPAATGTAADSGPGTGYTVALSQQPSLARAAE